MPPKNLEHVFNDIDFANAKDPNTEIVDGNSIPKELIYGQRMSLLLDKFHPNASEAVQIAARAQHICRWEIPRKDYPLDRVGYLKWRTELKKFHADKAAAILTKNGCSTEIIERVSFLLQKKKLKKDSETQLLEDVICLVFLEFYYDAFSVKHTDEKVIDILQKTWKKMSEKGHEAALQIHYSEKGLQLIKQALDL